MVHFSSRKWAAIAPLLIEMANAATTKEQVRRHAKRMAINEVDGVVSGHDVVGSGDGKEALPGDVDVADPGNVGTDHVVAADVTVNGNDVAVALSDDHDDAEVVASSVVEVEKEVSGLDHDGETEELQAGADVIQQGPQRGLTSSGVQLDTKQTQPSSVVQMVPSNTLFPFQQMDLQSEKHEQLENGLNNLLVVLSYFIGEGKRNQHWMRLAAYLAKYVEGLRQHIDVNVELVVDHYVVIVTEKKKCHFKYQGINEAGKRFESEFGLPIRMRYDQKEYELNGLGHLGGFGDHHAYLKLRDVDALLKSGLDVVPAWDKATAKEKLYHSKGYSKLTLGRAKGGLADHFFNLCEKMSSEQQAEAQKYLDDFFSDKNLKLLDIPVIERSDSDDDIFEHAKAKTSYRTGEAGADSRLDQRGFI